MGKRCSELRLGEALGGDHMGNEPPGLHGVDGDGGEGGGVGLEA